MNLKAFSLLELVIVIMILGILGTIALPYFYNTKFEAKLIKLKTEIELIKSGIAFVKNDFSLKNSFVDLEVLDEAKIGFEKEKLFFCSSAEIQKCNGLKSCCKASILSSPIYANKDSWMKISPNTYRFFLDKKNYVDFIYNPKNFSFECINSSLCNEFL